MARSINPARNKIYFYEYFVNEGNVENISDERNLESILKNVFLIWLYSTFTIGFCLILGAIEIDVLNYILFTLAFSHFVVTIPSYILFVKKALYFEIFKRKIYAFILPLPFILLALLILTLGTYDSVLLHIGRKDLIFLLAGDIFIPVLGAFFLYIIFASYAFLRCLSDYFLKRKPRMDECLHR